MSGAKPGVRTSEYKSKVSIKSMKSLSSSDKKFIDFNDDNLVEGAIPVGFEDENGG